jgi:LacI family transcriptional regulator
MVITDDFNSAYAATQHLIAAGCNSISLVTIEGYPSIFKAREEGYRKALTDEGITNINVLTCANTHSTGNVELIKAHLINNKPDGLLLTVEHLATATYTACVASGLQIPDDVKVVCFTNQITAAILNPPLTTVTQPAYEMGKAAAELLFRQLLDKQVDPDERCITIPSELVIRKSTG